MVMFSATWPLSVHQLAQEFMDPNPVKVWIFVLDINLGQHYLASLFGNRAPFQVVVGSEDLAANHDVMQIVEVWLAKGWLKRLFY